MREHDLPNRDNALALLLKRNFVVAEGFFTETKYPNKEAIIIAIMTTLREQEEERTNGDQPMLIVGSTVDQLQHIFETISAMINEKHPIMEGIDGKNITILRLNASSSTRLTDERTGITRTTIKKGELAYPMHPTPAH